MRDAQYEDANKQNSLTEWRSLTSLAEAQGYGIRKQNSITRKRCACVRERERDRQPNVVWAALPQWEAFGRVWISGLRTVWAAAEPDAVKCARLRLKMALAALKLSVIRLCCCWFSFDHPPVASAPRSSRAPTPRGLVGPSIWKNPWSWRYLKLHQDGQLSPQSKLSRTRAAVICFALWIRLAFINKTNKYWQQILDRNYSVT